jgi:gentisate 1,2-dioxygenase
MSTTFHATPGAAVPWEDFYGRLAQKNTAPLWEVLAALVTPEPKTPCIPAHWRYEEIRPLLMEAGERITAKQAERRVLILENPGMRGQSAITPSLYSGIQLVMPGEIAPSHRHTIAAFRFVLESDGGYTAVDGERTTMRPGDFVLTPPWTFHDHGNPGTKPCIWLDGLDAFLVQMLGAVFSEHYPADSQPVTKPEGDSLARYGMTLLPVDYKPERMSAPTFSYPWARSREALETMYRNGPIHPRHGVKLQYANPATGGSPFPIMGAFLQLLPKGFKGEQYRSTDATVFCCAEGSGRTNIGAEAFHWSKSDVFVAPSWYPVSHESDGDSVLFSFSDRPAQKALGLWRED